MLEAIDAAAVAAFQHAPQAALAAAQIAEAAQRARAGAVHEHQHRLAVLMLARLDRQQRALFAIAAPAVQPGRLVEPAFDRLHQHFGAVPADAQRGAVGKRFGLGQDGVGRAASAQQEYFADQAAESLAQAAAGGGAFGTQPVEQDGVAVEHLGMGQAQRLAQAVCAGDEGAFVGQFEDDDVVSARLQRMRALAAGAARCGGDVDAVECFKVAGRQEDVGGADVTMNYNIAAYAVASPFPMASCAISAAPSAERAAPENRSGRVAASLRKPAKVRGTGLRVLESGIADSVCS